MQSNEVFIRHFKAPSGDLRDISCSGQEVLGSTSCFLECLSMHLSFASKKKGASME